MCVGQSMIRSIAETQRANIQSHNGRIGAAESQISVGRKLFFIL